MQSRQVCTFGPFRLDAGERQLLREGKAVPLTPKCFDLLLLLVENSGHLLEKNQILERLWPDQFVEESNLSFNISVLRKALGENGSVRGYIETVPRKGFRFTSRVAKVSPELSNTQLETDPILAKAEGAIVEIQSAGPIPSLAAARFSRRLVV